MHPAHIKKVVKEFSNHFSANPQNIQVIELSSEFIIPWLLYKCYSSKVLFHENFS